MDISIGYLIAAVLIAAVVCACAIASVLTDSGADSFDDWDVHG